MNQSPGSLTDLSHLAFGLPVAVAVGVRSKVPYLLFPLACELGEEVIEKIIENLKANNAIELGEKNLVTPDKVKLILEDRL